MKCLEKLVIFFFVVNMCFFPFDHAIASNGFIQKERELLITIKVKVEEIDKRFEQVDKRFEQVDKRFEQIGK